RSRRGTSCRRSWRPPRPQATSASTAATSPRGTSAGARRPSASTTSTATRSWPSGRSRCASSRDRRSRRSRSSTTTPRRRTRRTRSGASRRRRRTRGCCGGCSTSTVSPPAAARPKLGGVDVLSVIHGYDARTELFAPVVRERGHRLDEWSFVWGKEPPQPLEAYDAVMVFGGAMHADQDSFHPWLRAEVRWLRELLERQVPTLGICLGVQLLARAAGSWVGPLPEPEIGWYEVELTEAGVADPVLGSLPRRFEAFQWHHYTFGAPEGAVELARSL